MYPAIKLLIDEVRRNGVFKRNKTPLEVKVLAAILRFSGLSYRKAAMLFGGLCSNHKSLKDVCYFSDFYSLKV